jgi:hypothetical protein
MGMISNPVSGFKILVQNMRRAKAFPFCALFLILPALGYGRDHSLFAERCIAANSGADSVKCLEDVFYKTEYEIAQLERRILAKLKHQRRTGAIGSAHHELAVSSLKEASAKFRKFSERHCDFVLGASGAVASGSGQVRWRCLIRLNDLRIKDLEGNLLE